MGLIAPQPDSADSPVAEPTAALQKILAATRRVAERDGIPDLSLLAVAREAGVAPAAVYASFNSKNDLLLSVVANDLATLAGAMRGAFDAANDRTRAPASPPLPAIRTGDPDLVATDVTSPETGTAVPTATADANNIQVPNSTGTAEAIARLQETVARLETRPVDAWLERRLREFERALSALEGRKSVGNDAQKSVEERFRELNETLGALEQRIAAAAEDAARSLTQRIDACENRLRSVASDTHADATALSTRITAVENAAFAARPEFFAAAPPPEPVKQEAETTPPQDIAPEAALHMAPEAASAEPILAAAAPLSSYLAAARKSAQDAAVAQDTREPKTPKRKTSTMVYVAMGLLFLFVAMLTAGGLMLRNMAMGKPMPPVSAHSQTLVRGVAARPMAAMNPQQHLRTLAEAGDAKAELLVGLDYLDGSGVQKNDAAAFAWLSRAAARNEPLAQYELGALYEGGHGVHTDPVQAFRWLESAALKGNRKAMHSLATAYAEGWGTTKNLFEAARWYGRAAQLGSVNDQFNLGVLFERGMGVTESLPDAYKWYAIAAAQGDKESQSRIAAIAAMLSPDDLAAARNAAQNFKPDALSSSANLPPVLAQKQ